MIDNTIWKCRDGREIQICKLSLEHLMRISKMLRRNGAVTSEEFISCARYASSPDTPDGAAMCAENELLEMKIHSQLSLIEQEISNRKKDA